MCFLVTSGANHCLGAQPLQTASSLNLSVFVLYNYYCSHFVIEEDKNIGSGRVRLMACLKLHDD